MAPTTTQVLQVKLTSENHRIFRQFTSQVTGRGLSVPEDNLLFFTYRVYANDVTRVLVSVGTCKPASPPSYPKDTAGSESPVDSCQTDLASLSLTSASSSTPPELPQSADPGNPGDDFLDPCSHIVEYLFTDAYYRCQGYGAQTLAAMESHCHSLNPHAPFKLLAASKAKPFFQRYHYEQTSQQPRENYQGINIFRKLYPMVKSADAVGLPCLPKVRQPKNKNKKRQKQQQQPQFVFC